MQKYQNFLVQAGRQCWPGDESQTSHKVAARPHDLYADQWISNIVYGGITDGASSTGSSFNYGGAFGNAPFDNTFVDTNGQTSHGFYKTGGDLSSTQFSSRHTPLTYHNGAKETSKCYQCRLLIPDQAL